MKIEIMDTTLRDGEQTSGVSFAPSEKMHIAALLLDELKVDRIEVASARVSEGEFEGVQRIVNWATSHNYLNKVEILGFIDNGLSIDWINEAGGKVVNLLSKGSLNHLKGQLRKTPEEHVADIKDSIKYATKLDIQCNLYLEDWSNGMHNSPDYVYFLIDALKDEKINRFMLPDTLGILDPYQVFDFCKKVKERFPQLKFDFHSHNDYDLATANALAAIKAGITTVHTTVNGLGERAGNAPLASVIAVLKDHTDIEMSINESKIYKTSKLVETFSTLRIPPNQPITGESVFTQTCGVHADGDNKNKLYFNDLLPERFGRIRKYALGKTAGKANILKNLEALGLELSTEAMKRVTDKVIELGDKKEYVTTEDLPYIISDVLKSEIIKTRISIVNYSVNHTLKLRSVATLAIKIDDTVYEETSAGDGQYDAFMNALKKIYTRLKKKIPRLLDYTVSIPPGGKTDALVQAIVTWEGVNKQEFKTRGLDSDQTAAAIKATIKMLNILENKTLQTNSH